VFKKLFRTFTSVTVVAALGISVALAQDPPPKQAKDEAEVELFKQSNPQTNPNATTRLSALSSWKEKYPDTAFKLERALFYALTYQQLNQGANMLGSAKEVLAIDPAHFYALGWVASLTESLITATALQPTPDNLSTGEKAAQALLQTQKAPTGVTDEQWKQMKPPFDAMAHKTLGFIAGQRKQFDVAEQEYIKSAQIDPTQALVAYAVGSSILKQNKPERYPEALFYIARATNLGGPGALPPALKKPYDDFLVRSYAQFHGQDDAGLKELRQIAISQPMPPAGFTIKDKNTIQAEKEAEFAKSNPQLAFWKTLKEGLSAENGEQYFEMGVKDAQLPPPAIKKLKGKLVSMKPAIRPNQLVLAMDGDTPEVTLKFETNLPGKADPGTEIEFEGVGDSFTKSPFMLTFKVEDKDKITGWPAQAAAPSGQKKAAPGAGVKKAAPAPAKK